MKAAVCRQHGAPLVIEDLLVDPPRHEEVCVHIRACAICHSDIAALRGDWGEYDLPMVVGHEAAGVVDSVGPGVSDFVPGDSVAVTLVRSCGRCRACLAGHTVSCTGDIALDRETRLHTHDGQRVIQGLRAGAFAEYCVVHRSQIVKIPPDVPPVSAALLGCAVITGYGSVTRVAQIREGSTVVVVGTGGVGLNAVQGAVGAGAAAVIAVDITSSKLAAATALGATSVINAAETDATQAVLELTGNEGADYVLVAVGHRPSIENGITMLNRFGVMVLMGMPASDDRFLRLDAHELTAGRRILGSKMGDTCITEDIPGLVSLYQSGRLKLDELISNTYPLDGINQAIAAAQAGDALRNVITF